MAKRGSHDDVENPCQDAPGGLSGGDGGDGGERRRPALQAQLAPPLDLKPVSFNADVKESIGLFTEVANTVFKPAGDGPFPAVVLMHTCGGLVGAPNAHMKEHAQQLLAVGYVALGGRPFPAQGL